ncbi:GcrA family cell cycle regulator [Porphyrobacter sp. GA68]|uniref:GcrA family cell cycle regulator n=1 Tax=Porphyrobacter sp. GA68 TaxID=2883480 RepID=UPI001D187DD1|nr:GcrA family cell cycle regulator [Porphyrobacter sp. GA68]
MSWTEERIAKLKSLWESGATASQISDALGGVSRNAVIGKAHRLGLKARPSPVKSGAAKAKQPAKNTEPASEAAVETTPAVRPVKTPPVVRKDKPVAAEPAATPPKHDQPAEEVTAPAPSPQEPPEAASTGAQVQPVSAPTNSAAPRIVSVGPGGFLRQGPGDQQAPIPPAPPRRLVPAKPSPEIAGKTSLLDLSERVCRWPMGHPGEADFHFCGEAVNPGFPYCVEHCGRAYQAQLPRGVRRPPPPLPFGGPRVR